MTLEQLFLHAQQYDLLLLTWFTLLPFLSWISARFTSGFRRHKIRYRWLSLLVYMAAVPGILALVLTVYALVFTHQNLLRLNLLIYLVPIVSMLTSFYLISRHVKFRDIPGFERLSALLVLLALTFVVILFLLKLRIFVGFFASFWVLLLLALALFWGFQWALKKLTR